MIHFKITFWNCFSVTWLDSWNIICSNWDRPQHAWKSYPVQSQVLYDNPFIYKLKINFLKTEHSVWKEYLSYLWVQKAMNSWCMGVFANFVASLLPQTTDWLEWALTCPLSYITMNLKLSQCTCEMYSADQRLLIVQHVHPGEDAPHQQCCVKDKYTDEWKIFQSPLHQMKIKYENLYFSWVRHALC